MGRSDALMGGLLMQVLGFTLVDVKSGMKAKEQGEVMATVHTYMGQVLGRLPGEPMAYGVEIGPGKPHGSVNPLYIVVYIVPDVDQSVIASLGLPVTDAKANDKVLGLTVTEPARKQSISEVYWNRCFSPQECAGSAFHEAAHYKSLQGNAMHQGQ